MKGEQKRAVWALVAMILVITIGAVCQTGCTHAVTKTLVTAEDQIHDALVDADTKLNGADLCGGPLGEKFKAPCADSRRLLADTAAAAAEFNRAIRDAKVAGLSKLIAAGGKLLDSLKALPESQTAMLVTDIAKAIAAAYQSAATK